MRIYRTRRVRREWTDADRTLAKKLHSSGFGNSEIATALDRNPDAVRAWVHHNCRVWQEPEVANYPRTTVPFADVPHWYELGWRFAGTENGDHIFEWRSSGIARMPRLLSVTSEQATTELEVAA